MLDMGRGGWSLGFLLLAIACSDIDQAAANRGPPPPGAPIGARTSVAPGDAGTASGGAGGFGARRANGGAGGANGIAGTFGAAGDTSLGAPGNPGFGIPGGGTMAAGGSQNLPGVASAVDCVAGPCGAPNVCVNLDFLFVACVPCGGNDQVCCPPFVTLNDPFFGTCDPGLICAGNPNFQASPPMDLVQDVCQIPGSPPPADGRLNHERLLLFP
jgi:hypothetical protein